MTSFDPIEEQTGYDPDTETYHARVDTAAGDALAYTVLTAVSAVTGDAPCDLPSITRAINVDALEHIVCPVRERPSTGDVTVTFSYNGCAVTVERGGHVIIDPPPD